MLRRTLAVLLALAFTRSAAAAEDPYRTAREAMVKTIESIAASDLAPGRLGEIDQKVLDAMRLVPRHELVPEEIRPAAYEDRPLPIGYGQTISQPYIVALMTDLLQPEPGDVMLEVGTGSGYQAAVLGELVDEVYSIEIVPELAERAEQALKTIGQENVTVKQGDGYHGWPEHAPFDGIVVTAAATHIPPPLVQQLKPGARLIVPVGPPFMLQHLMLVEKDEAGQIRTESLLPVSFVPLIGSGQ